jgi:hypothetical protein
MLSHTNSRLRILHLSTSFYNYHILLGHHIGTVLNINFTLEKAFITKILHPTHIKQDHISKKIVYHISYIKEDQAHNFIYHISKKIIYHISYMIISKKIKLTISYIIYDHIKEDLAHNIIYHISYMIISKKIKLTISYIIYHISKKIISKKDQPHNIIYHI